MPCTTPPLNLTLRGHRIDDAAAVVNDDVVEQLHLTGRWVDFKFHRVCADPVGQR